MRGLPTYATLGLLAVIVSQVAMLLRIEPFWSWHTPTAWTGYLLFIDGVLWKRRRSSWLVNARREFAFLAICSVLLWLVFEFYNLFIENWSYVGLPENPVLRYVGYIWSFATIWPAIFLTGELIASFKTSRPPPARPAPPIPLGAGGWVAVGSGAALLAWPLLWPSPYLAAPVWLGFVLLLDPINASHGNEALLTDLRAGRHDRVVNLVLAGFWCGLLWEFWNYWARAKWIYTVPILPEVRLFEMPLPGYLGFPAFALECFTMYVTVRWLVFRGACRPISL